MRRIRLFTTLLAVMAIRTSAASPAEAQAGTAVREKTVTAPRRKPAEAQPPRVRRDTANAGKSISERLFDAQWVLFPARLALAIVFLTVALLLLIGGSWAAARLAHSLRHLNWKQPPRRLKRGEVGAAGTTLAVEWEERLSTNTENDEERDRQISSLREVVNQLTRDHNRIAARLAAIGESEGDPPDEETEDLG
jgi:hypothetical protein